MRLETMARRSSSVRDVAQSVPGATFGIELSRWLMSRHVRGAHRRALA
jgi:hypothetical protein